MLKGLGACFANSNNGHGLASQPSRPATQKVSELDHDDMIEKKDSYNDLHVDFDFDFFILNFT